MCRHSDVIKNAMTFLKMDEVTCCRGFNSLNSALQSI